ncbi:MAG: CRISPR-associated endoribonuclease Cas6 [Cuniculiplasma sp.]
MSRLRISFTTTSLIKYIDLDKHFFQSYVYSCLSDKGDTHLHTGNHFRHFSFGNPYPSGDLNPGSIKNILISSPDDDIIKKLQDAMEQRGEIWFGKNRVEILDVKKYNMGIHRAFQTGSPIVLYKNNRNNIYYSLRNGDTLSQLLIRMKENSVKRFRDFSGDNGFELNRPLFDLVQFQREVSTPIQKGNSKFSIIGTTYYRLERVRINSLETEFYRYLMDGGLGEKTSFGFGFLNPVKEGI